MDWVVYWLTSASGLALIGAAIVVPFVIWRIMLGPIFTVVGIKPLAFAYLCAACGLVAMSFVSSYAEFSGRETDGILQEAQRWSIVPHWTFHLTILSLIHVLPLLGLVGVPVAASFLKRGRLTLKNIVACALVLWLVLTILGWAFPGNEWHSTHRLESFLTGLKDLLPLIFFIAMPFMLAIYGCSPPDRLRPL
ncbi:hypothetical protein [Massilia horti]|uniref:Transmembrane protein n=1 Tax=Massilia horti TaxID=2562153 RepID=A0A4Y9SKV8_9BURK|nr:hypothetical protein [Massilia horti]TFW27322.1 hypothetical protein E4O92_24360 [Massilia horti]